jgi:hypothetical protein
MGAAFLFQTLHTLWNTGAYLMWKGFLIGSILAGLGVWLFRRNIMDVFIEIYCAKCAKKMRWMDGTNLNFHVPIVGWQSIRVCTDCLELVQENGTPERNAEVRKTQAEQDEALARLWGLE